MVFDILDSTGVLVLLAVLVLGGLLFRRTVLRRNGASLDCALRIGATRAGHGWHLGLMRYTPLHLQWYRIFSAAPHPKYTLVRRSIAVIGRREPRGFELHSIPQGAVVVQCRALTDDGHEVELELAMGEAAMTGFLAWLESAPPGAHQGQRRR